MVGLLELDDLHEVVQTLLGVLGVVTADVEGVDASALVAVVVVAVMVGVVVVIFPAPAAGFRCRGVVGRGCSGRSCIGSGVLRWMVMRRLCGGSGPFLMRVLRRRLCLGLLGLRSLGLSFCVWWRRSAVALLLLILLAVEAMFGCAAWSAPALSWKSRATPAWGS
ncbi:MAG: hypothetical protein CMJ27_14810 [Phycisphaerae bacterium]|nr:hypothetical protein [Phycisphaerae bacterium]